MKISNILFSNANFYATKKSHNSNKIYSSFPKKNFNCLNYKNYQNEYLPFIGYKNLNILNFNLSFNGNDSLREKIQNAIQESPIYSNAGYKGVVYKISINSNDYAVKVARGNEAGLEKEASILKRIPSSLKNCQRFVDYFRMSESNKEVLVSTFIPGKKGTLRTEEDFNKFFNTIFLLDTEGVLHGDLNMQNCLFDGDDINLIDFGEGQIFNTGDTYKDFIYPNFILKCNGINFEHNGMPDCIKEWARTGENIQELFRGYLSSKARYYEKHANFLRTQSNIPPETIQYEENCANVLRNPSERIVENEIRRIDTLYTFEHSDTAVNYTKIPEAAERNWNLTIKKAKENLHFAETVLKNPDLPENERVYFENQRSILELFYKQFNKWGDSTIVWLKDIPNKTLLSEHEKELMKNKGKNMEIPPDLVGMVLDDTTF